MSKRPIESLKETADQLAYLIVTGSNNKKKMHELEQYLHFDSAPNTADIKDIKKETVQVQEKRVGIWIPRLIKGREYYVRDEKYKKEFYSWAKVPRIPPKNSKRRIIYLGESAARGFLLEPFYTPAPLLENLINSNLKPWEPQVEVIDLARTDCDLHLLTELCSTCQAMKPDVIVILAGNNWINGFEFTESLVDKITGTMETGERFAGLKRIIEEQYKEMIVPFMKHVDHISRTYQVPVVLVIPEFNLLDFPSNSVQRINLWPKGETREWLGLKEKSEQALKEEDTGKAELLIRQMIKLNEGNPYGFELLARCKLKHDLFPEAGEYLRRALDTAMFRGQNVPCCISVIRDTLLEEAAKYKMTVADLVEVFKEFQSGRPPGRELFLDYCHFTVEGIQIVVASIAQRLLSLFTNKAAPAAELVKMVPKPDSSVIARSHFFAAIHNAHRGEQPYDILYYHCTKALNESLSVKDLMLNYIKMASRHTEWSLSKECEKLFESGEMEQFSYILQPRNHYLMDVELVDAIAAALKEHGIDVRDQVLTFRKKEHGFMNGKINLLESYYYLFSYTALYRPSDSFYRAFSVQSHFFLVTGKDSDILIDLTCRVPGPNPKKEKILFKVNDSIAAELTAGNKWENFSLEISKESLNDGVNIITLQWPPDVEYNKNLKENPYRGNASGLSLIKRMMYPLYGEIHMFTARRKPEKLAEENS